MVDPSLLGKVATFAYRKWGLKGVLGVAVAGVVLYVLRERGLDRLAGGEGSGQTTGESEATGAAE